MLTTGKTLSHTLVLKVGKTQESHPSANNRQNFETLSGAESWHMLKSHTLALKMGKV